MKDAHGYGSNGRRGNDLANHVEDTDRLRVLRNAAIERQRATMNAALRDRLPGSTILKSVTSNAEAANSLMSTLKSTQAPVHPSMASLIRSAPLRYNDPRSDEQELNRVLVSRMRHGGV